MKNIAIEFESESAYALDPHTLRLVLKVQKGEPFKEIGVLWNNKYNFAKNRNFARMKKYCSDYQIFIDRFKRGNSWREIPCSCPQKRDGACKNTFQ